MRRPSCLAMPGDDAKYASNPVDFDVDRTVGDNDQRHRLVASGVYGTNRLAGDLTGVARALANGWWVSAILTAQSGQSYSARVNGDLNGDGNTQQRSASRHAAQRPSLSRDRDAGSAHRS